MSLPMSETGTNVPRGRRRMSAFRFGTLVAAMAAFAATPAVAQQTGTITGRVVNVQQQPVAEAVIQVAGQPNLSSLTNPDGNFVILNVPVGTYEMTATYLGYGTGRASVTVPANGSAVADFTLQPRAVQIEGVVVTGTAINANKREIGNTIELITSADIEAAGVTTIDELFRGQIRGMTVMGSSAQVGTGSNITLRGINSIYGRNNPLIYVDGVRMNDSGAYETDDGSVSGAATVLNSIHPSEIERIEVIKGAAASTLYGTEASAGVIQIFTKQGLPGQGVQWSFVTDQNLSVPKHMLDKDIDPTGLHINDCSINGPLPLDTVPGPDPGCPSSGSWVRNAWSQDYSLSARGGGDDFSFFASGGFNRAEGVVNVPDGYDPQTAEGVNLRANFTFDGFDNLEVRINNSYSRRDLHFIPDGDNSEGLFFNVTSLTEGETPDDRDDLVFDKALDQYIDQFVTGMNLNWTPMDNMRHRVNAGLSWSNSNYQIERPLGFYNREQGNRDIDIETNRVITMDYAGSFLWDMPFLNNVNSTTSWGLQIADRNESGVRAGCEEFAGPGTQVLENCNWPESVNIFNEDRFGSITGGAFLQQQFGWNNQFFVTAGGRWDTHSSFSDVDLSAQREFVFYPKLSATYTVSDHYWWPTNLIDTFRLRTAFGESGEPPSASASVTYWQPAGADNGQNGFIIQSIATPTIGPETTREIEGGLDASVLNGRASLTGTYFYRKTTDGLLFNDLPASNGVLESVEENAGEWKTEGIETTVDVNIIETDNFRFNLNTGYQWSRSEMLDIGNDDDNQLAFSYNNRYRVGQPFPATYENIVTNPDEVGALPEFSDDDEFIGLATPPNEVSVGTNFAIGTRLTLDLFGYGQWGHVLIDDGAQELATDGLWPPCNELNLAVEDAITNNTVDQLPYTASEIGLCSQRYATNGIWAQPADYFRLSSVTASYRLPEEWLPGGFSAATVQLRAQNLALFTDFPGIDPDAIISAGTQQNYRAAGYTLPLPTTFAFNLRLNF